MKYLWIIIILVLWVLWGICGIKSLIDNIEDDIETGDKITLELLINNIVYSEVFLSWSITTLVVLFVVSLGMYVFSKLD